VGGGSVKHHGAVVFNQRNSLNSRCIGQAEKDDVDNAPTLVVEGLPEEFKV
jgi:hypothetical protein